MTKVPVPPTPEAMENKGISVEGGCGRIAGGTGPDVYLAAGSLE